MDFKLCNLGSRQPYFNSAYVVRVPTFSFTTVLQLSLLLTRPLPLLALANLAAAVARRPRAT